MPDTNSEDDTSHLDKLAQHVPGVLYQYVLHPDGSSAFPYASRGLQAIYGVLPEQVRDDATPVFSVIHPDDVQRIARSISDSAQQLGMWQAEYRVCLPGHGERWVSGQASAQRLPSGSVLWHGYIYDVTERKARELELDHAHKAAQQASQAKSQYLAQLSHEIRTPMASIIGLSQLGMTMTDPARLRDVQLKILSSGRLVLGILNDVLDLSKIEAGKMEIDPQPFLLGPVLDSVVALFAMSAQAKGLEFLFELDPRLAQAYVGDDLRLNQVLSNLVSNAIKFTNKGTVTMRVRWLTHSDGVDTLEFSVIDTGVGLSEQQRQRLFKAFMQAGPSVTRQHGGSGLGLNISQNLVTAMGGSPIRVHSQPGVGSTFHFELPLARCPQTQVDELHERSAQTEPRAQSLQGHVLLVEDNPINQEVTVEQLHHLGLTVSVANNGEQAVQKVQQQGAAFDLVLMDIQMPVMDGYSAATALRKTHPDLPIIALTAAAMIEDRQKALHVGMNGHVSKPVELSRLREVLAQWLGVSADANGAGSVMAPSGKCLRHYPAGERSGDAALDRPEVRPLSRERMLDQLRRLHQAVLASEYVDDSWLQALLGQLPQPLQRRYRHDVQQAMDTFDMERAGTLFGVILAELERAP